MEKENLIQYISSEDLQDSDILINQIYGNEKVNYYYSDDFSKNFYIELARLGFITTSLNYENKLYLLPEIQFEYAILDFKNLHISKKVQTLLKKENYLFEETTDIKKIIELLDNYHKEDNWLVGEYQDLLISLKDYKHPNIDFQLKGFLLKDKNTKTIIAGELGYKINNTYTSLTGFSSKDKKYNNYGKLQMVLLSFYLEKENYSFWNLGHPYMKYKFELGAKEYKRNDFLKRWFS